MARAKKDREEAATPGAPTEPPSPPEADEKPKPKHGRAVASARGKTKAKGETASPAEKKARLAIARAKKGRDRDKVRSIDSAPLMTAPRAFVAGLNNPITVAFLHEEGLRGGVRKLTRSQWKAELDKFIKAPR